MPFTFWQMGSKRTADGIIMVRRDPVALGVQESRRAGRLDKVPGAIVMADRVSRTSLPGVLQRWK